MATKKKISLAEIKVVCDVDLICGVYTNNAWGVANSCTSVDCTVRSRFTNVRDSRAWLVLVLISTGDFSYNWGFGRHLGSLDIRSCRALWQLKEVTTGERPQNPTGMVAISCSSTSWVVGSTPNAL